MNPEDFFNIEILKELQNCQPWLGRVFVDDERFANSLNNIIFKIPKNKNSLSVIDNQDMDNLIAFVKNCNQIYLGNDKTVNSTIYPSFIIWFHNICSLNKLFYRKILSVCFDSNNLLQSHDQRKCYIASRLLQLEVDDSQLDDVYYILKGYFDSMYLIGDKAADLFRTHYDNKEAFINYANSRYKQTAEIRDINNADEISEIFLRDLLLKLNMKTTA